MADIQKLNQLNSLTQELNRIEEKLAALKNMNDDMNMRPMFVTMFSEKEIYMKEEQSKVMTPMGLIDVSVHSPATDYIGGFEFQIDHTTVGKISDILKQDLIDLKTEIEKNIEMIIKNMV